MSKYTITIQGPEGAEVYEGNGFLMFLQKASDETRKIGKTTIVGKHFVNALLPDTLAQNHQLLPLAFSAVGLAIGRYFSPNPAMLDVLAKALSGEEDKTSEEDE